MHARHYQWTVLLLSTLAFAVGGCRGTRPQDKFVKVTQEPAVGAAEIEAPRQRLAVNKPKTAAENVEIANLSDPPIRREQIAQASAQQRLEQAGSDPAPRPEPSPRTSRPTSDTVAMSFGDRDSGSAKSETQAATASATDRSLQAPVDSVSDSKATTKVASATAADAMAGMSEEEMVAAFEGQPEYIRELVAQQLRAAIARTAEKTNQPAAVDAAIASSVDDLPVLPPASDEEPAVPAHRIAAASKPSDAPGYSNKETNPAGSSDVEPVVVQTLSDRSQRGEVQPASASQGDREVPLVSQAGVEPQSGSDPQPAPAGLTDQQLYAELLKRMSQAPLGESEADRASRLIKQRHLMVLAGNPDAAVEKIEAMSRAEQEYLRHQLLGLWTMIDPQGHPVPSRRFTTALPQMREATKFAAAATDSLEVRSLAFCTAIEAYGQIKPFSGNRFDAGQQVILYCEVENFTVTEVTEGYQTHLQGSYDIYNDDNEKVVSQLLPADQQISANYLRDYFIAYQMHLPQQLSPGTYRLQLTMEDVSGKKYGQASIPLEIKK